jgi:hypothetical protein
MWIHGCSSMSRKREKRRFGLQVSRLEDLKI